MEIYLVLRESSERARAYGQDIWAIVFFVFVLVAAVVVLLDGFWRDEREMERYWFSEDGK